MKGIVVECPPGVFTRIMPESKAWELYHSKETGTKSNPKGKTLFYGHMEELHRKYLKERGEL